jgi:hypothetical protein
MILLIVCIICALRVFGSLTNLVWPFIIILFVFGADLFFLVADPILY